MRRIIGLVFIILLVIVVGCGPMRTLEASRDAYSKMEGQSGVNDVTMPDPNDDWFLVDLSKKYGLMALFALTVYRYDLSPNDRDRHACDYLNPDFSGDRNFGMPMHSDHRSEFGRWVRWVPAESAEGDEPPCYTENGLFYETYVHFDSHDKITEGVIAYRGTENRKGQWAKDWGANIGNAMGIEPEAYAIARTRLKKLTNRLSAASNGAPIYAVGHSLGGGLAQQAGYLSKDIKEVYTFNTSPVTNWSSLRLLGLVEQGCPIIHRIYNGGEGLAGVRSIATASTRARYGRHDVGIQFGPKAFVSGHAMGLIACNFAKILKETKAEGAAHDYPVSYIERHVLKRADGKQLESDRRICDDERS